MTHACKYDEYLYQLGTQLGVLSERARAGVFWLCGVGLRFTLLVPNEWATWLQDVEVVGKLHVLGREWEGEGIRLWEQSNLLSSAENEMSAHLLSSVGCFGSSLCVDPPGGDPRWVNDVLTPVMMSVSLDVDDTVAWPAFDEGVDALFASDRVQAAVAYVDRIVDVLAAHPEPDEVLLDELLVGAQVLSPPAGYDV